jgi:hypothetical protein
MAALLLPKFRRRTGEFSAFTMGSEVQKATGFKLLFDPFEDNGGSQGIDPWQVSVLTF